jgi:uncharacterized protein YutE (UPF0331/DUF86 family)
MNLAFNGVIQRKLSLMETQVGKLEQSLRDVEQAKFVEDWVLRSMAERALQVATEIIIDVAERILAIKGVGPAASAAEAIERLVQLGILKSAEPYVRMVRFRNLLVHQYEEINPALLFDLARNRLDDFRRFRAEVDRAAAD